MIKIDCLRVINNIRLNEQIEEDLQCSYLKLKVDKKEFSPNRDNIDDTVNFSVLAPKNKGWVLDINSSEGNIINTFTGTGTGKKQDILWNGHDNSSQILEDDDYKIILNSNNQSKEVNVKIHNYNDLTMISYPEENLEGEVEDPPIQEDQYASDPDDMTFSTAADIEPPKSAFVEYVKAVVKDSNSPSKANLINNAIDQALKTTKEKMSLIKAENLTRKTVENSLKSYNPKSKTSYSSYLKSFSNVLGGLVAYSIVKDIFISNQEIDVITVDTNHVDTYQSECKAIKFKSTLQSSGYAPEQKLKGKWKIYYVYKDDFSTYPDQSDDTKENAILARSIDTETTFKLDKADLSLTWDGLTNSKQKARDGKYMAVFVPNPEKENLFLPNSGIKFRMKRAVSFLFNIVDTDKIANQVKAKIVGNNSFATNSIAGMSGNFIGARIPMISAGTTEVQNALRKLDISGTKLNGNFINLNQIYGKSPNNNKWVSPLVRGLEDVIDPYNMAGVMSVVTNGSNILDEAIKSEGCSKFAPKSIFLKVIRTFMPVVDIDSIKNLRPRTNHNKSDVLRQIGDSNESFRLLYINTLRGLNNPYASDRIIAGSGGEGADVTFLGVVSNQIKYVEFKSTNIEDPIKSVIENGYMTTLKQINSSRNNLGYGLGIGFTQSRKIPTDLNYVMKQIKKKTSQPNSYKEVYFSLVDTKGTMHIDSANAKDY